MHPSRQLSLAISFLGVLARSLTAHAAAPTPQPDLLLLMPDHLSDDDCDPGLRAVLEGLGLTTNFWPAKTVGAPRRTPPHRLGRRPRPCRPHRNGARPTALPAEVLF